MPTSSIQGSGSTTLLNVTGNPCGFLIDITATTIGDVSIADIETVNISCVLMRDGSNTQILAGNLWALGQSDMPSSYEGLAIGSHKSFFVPFGGTINLKGTDQLQTTLTVGTSNTGQVTTITSQEGVGAEVYTPRVFVYSFDSNRTNQPVPAGDNVSKISIVNTTTANKLTACNIRGSHWSDDYQTPDFFAMMASQWERSPEHYSYVIYSDAELDNVTINTTIDTAASTNTYCVVYGGVQTPGVVQRAMKTFRKVEDSVRSKFKL